MVGLSRVKDHQKLWFQSKNKRLKPMVYTTVTLSRAALTDDDDNDYK